MKRLLVSAAALPLVYAAAAHAETKISAPSTAPVQTSTLANGQPDDLTIDTTGSVAPTAAGVAVTVDSSNNVANNGAISFNNVSNATDLLIKGGVTTNITSAGTIAAIEDYTATDSNGDGVLDGPFAQGSNRYGIRAVGPGVVTGTLTHSGAIQIEGNDSAGISIETQWNGTITHSGSISVTGDRDVGVRVDSVTGNLNLTGAISGTGQGTIGAQVGNVGGTLLLQNAITTTGYKTTTRLDDASRAKLLPEDLLQGGPAVLVTGSVAHGILLDTPPADTDPNNPDEDNDGVPDASESTGVLTTYGAAPALLIGSTTNDINIGDVGTADKAFGLINKGSIVGDGVNDAVTGTGLQIGQAGGGKVTVQGGIYNVGGASIAGVSYGAVATGLLLNSNAVVSTIDNAGTIGAEENGGLHDARALVDLSGTVGYVQNSGTIKATITTPSGVTQTGQGIAIDVSANTSGVLVRQMRVNSSDTPAIGGDIRFGSGDDRLELLAGTYAGTVSFGAGADSLVIDGGATASATLTDSDNRLDVDVRNGTLALGNTTPLTLTSLHVGSTGSLTFNVDPNSTAARLQVNGAATIDTGAQFTLNLTALSRGSRSYQVIQAQSLTVGSALASLAGAPYLYQASLRTDVAAGGLYVDIRPKTAAELGLNRSGSEAYSAVFDSLDKDPNIESAFLSQTTQAGFQQIYDQMLPDHSGGVLMSAASASAAVSSAVAQPLAIEKTAGQAFWAQEIGFNMSHARKDALGYKAQGFGFAAGLDLEGESNALGADVSFVTSDVKDKGAAAGENVTMNLVGTGLYWRVDGGPLQAAVRGGVGYAFLNGDRRLVSSTLNLRAKANWHAWMADAYAGASYEFRAGAFYLRPELSAAYLRLSESGYNEDGGGDGFDLSVDKRTGDLLTGQALVAVGFRVGDDVYFAPEVKAGYKAKIAGGPGSTTAHFDGGSDFTLDPEDVSSGGPVVRAGIRGGSARVLYVLDGGAVLDSNQKEYDVRAAVRFQF